MIRLQFPASMDKVESTGKMPKLSFAPLPCRHAWICTAVARCPCKPVGAPHRREERWGRTGREGMKGPTCRDDSEGGMEKTMADLSTAEINLGEEALDVGMWPKK